MWVEVIDALRCARNLQEGAGEEAVWDPGWMPVNQDFYLETSLKFGNEARSQGGKGWGCSGLSASLTPANPSPCQVRWQSQQWSWCPPVPFSGLSSPSQKGKKKTQTKWKEGKDTMGNTLGNTFLWEFLAASELFCLRYNFLDISNVIGAQEESFMEAWKNSSSTHFIDEETEIHTCSQRK